MPDKEDVHNTEDHKDSDLLAELIDADLDEVAAGHSSNHQSKPQ